MVLSQYNKLITFTALSRSYCKKDYLYVRSKNKTATATIFVDDIFMFKKINIPLSNSGTENTCRRGYKYTDKTFSVSGFFEPSCEVLFVNLSSKYKLQVTKHYILVLLQEEHVFSFICSALLS
jgi:hypothetical protein